MSAEFNPTCIVNHIHSLKHDPNSKFNAQLNLYREKHKDGGIHYHAYVAFAEAFRTRSSTIFDVKDGQSNITIHPNIKGVSKTPWVCYDYVSKDGDPIHQEILRPPETSIGKAAAKKAATDWATIIQQPTEKQYWAAIRLLAPDKLATNYNNLRAYAKDQYPDTEEANILPEREVELLPEAPQELHEWVDTFNAPNQTDNERYALLAYICLHDM